MDVVNTAHAFGLLRLPKMPELRGRDLSVFKKCNTNTADIPYLNKKLEKNRQVMLVERRKLNEIEKSKKSNKEKDMKKQRTRKRDRSGRQKFDEKDFDDLDNDYKLMKRFKKGKLSKDEFDDKFLSNE